MSPCGGLISRDTSSRFIHVAGVRTVLWLRLHYIPRRGIPYFVCTRVALDTGGSRHAAVADAAAVKVPLSPSLAAFGVLGKGPFPAFQVSSSHASFLDCKPLILQKCVNRSFSMAVPAIIMRPRGPPSVPRIPSVFLFYSTDGTSLEAQGWLRSNRGGKCLLFGGV